MPLTNAVSKLKDIVARCTDFLAGMVQLGFQPDAQKTLRRRFTMAEVAVLVGRERSSIAKAENELGIVVTERNPATNRRLGYTLEQVQTLREHFGTLPWRDPNMDPPMIIACQNFKGGVGKSTTCIHLSHYLALRGYRVLVVDADHQATTTSMFGYLPDRDLGEAQTILPYISGEQSSLNYAVRPTYWPNIDLIPACLALSEAEIAIVLYLAGRQSPQERIDFFRELRIGLEGVASAYDVVLIDSPPSNGMIALSVLLAADALLIPTAARMYDFSSTTQFLQMIANYIEQVDPGKEYRWIKVLTTMFDRRYKAQKMFVDMMADRMGDFPFERVFMHHRDIANGAAQFRTPYEEEKPRADVLEMLDSVFGEIEMAILREWPSKQSLLLQKGIA